MDGQNKDTIQSFDIRGTVATGLTVDYAWNIGKALADWLPTAGRVLVVSLPSQGKIKAAIIEGLRLQGRSVVDGGNAGRDGLVSLIKELGLSGGVLIGYDDLESVTIIEAYKEDGRMVDAQTGLRELDELARAGNFVPAVVKGELTAVA